jgi:5-methylcytosine-specific restriction endonuclease McrA
LDTYKVCEQCGEQYIANPRSITVQKYCSQTCKEKKTWSRFKESGDIRRRKGGYNRTVYIRTWMKARQSDNTAPCHYCQKRLSPDNFVLDHKVPLTKLTSRKEMMDESNLCVCCRECNVKKSSQDYDEFIRRMNE